MKEIWVLSTRTSLPYKCVLKADLKTIFTAFETFSDARKAMRETIKGFAFSENSMFDGEGRITALDEYIDEMYDFDEDDFSDEESAKDLFSKIQESLYTIFNGEDTVPELKKGEFTDSDCMVAFKYDGKSIILHGVFDGPLNGYEPYIATNAFSMKEEKDYYIHIDDLFGQEYSSELYIDLKKVKLN